MSPTTRTLPRLYSTMSNIRLYQYEKKKFTTIRRFLPHVIIVIIIIFYMISGAFMFIWLESGKDQSTMHQYSFNDRQENDISALRGNITEMLRYCSDLKPFQTPKTCMNFRKAQLNELLTIWKRSEYSDLDEFFSDNSTKESATDWGFKNGFLLAFSIVTTVGYGRLTPTTTAGRIFCVFYAVFGIPLCVLGIANIGRFMSDGFLLVYKKLILFWRVRKIQDIDSRKKIRYLMQLQRVPAPILLVVFFSWALLGSLIIPLWEPINPFEACYFVIISLTTVGFGDFVPTSSAFMYLTCVYLALGLIITTMAIDVLAEYLLKLHYLGKKMKNMGETTVWLGGRKITVETLFAGVLKKLDVSDELFHTALANLDHLIEHTIDQQVSGFYSYSIDSELRCGQNGTMLGTKPPETHEMSSTIEEDPNEQTKLSGSLANDYELV